MEFASVAGASGGAGPDPRGHPGPMGPVAPPPLEKTTENQQQKDIEQKGTVKTRTDFPETWLWQTIKIK